MRRWTVWLLVVGSWSGAWATDVAERALALYDGERYAEARALFEQLDAAGEADGAALYRLAFCYRVAKQAERERATLGRAVERLQGELAEATDLEPAFYLANALANLGRAAEVGPAAARGTAAVEAGRIDPTTSPLSSFRAGKLYADQRRDEDAARWYALAVEGFAAEPSSFPAYLKWAARFLADHHFRRNDPTSAERYLQTLVDVGAASQGDFDRLAVARVRLSDYAGAREAWRRAEQADPVNGDRARYAGHLARMAEALVTLPPTDESGLAWSLLSKEQLETVMSTQAERVKTAKEEAAVTDDPLRRAELAAEVEAARPLFVAAGLEYAADYHPIRATAFIGGYAPLIFKDSAWKLPEKTD